jgi:hypothetical protein
MSVIYNLLCPLECPCCGNDLRDTDSISIQTATRKLRIRTSVGRTGNIEGYALDHNGASKPLELRDDQAIVTCTGCYLVIDENLEFVELVF